MDFLFNFPDVVFTKVEYLVGWVGFSTIIGLIASLIVLGRKGIPVWGAIVIGYAGTIIGWAVASQYTRADESVNKIDWQHQLYTPAAIIIALIGTVGLLFLYKLVLQQGANQSAGSTAKN